MKHSDCGLDCESCSEVPCPVANDDRDVASKFHAHLDNCGRCRNQPFNLCPIGQRLIQEAASERAMTNKAAQELGRLGGLARSEAKARAARANGTLGGRPRKRRKPKRHNAAREPRGGAA